MYNPTKVDLTPFGREIEDQGNIGACVANATVSDVELITYRAHENYNLSRLALYHDTLVYENRLGQDGLVSVDAIKVGSTVGIGDEALWGYDVTQQYVTPPTSYYTSASNQKITGYHSIGLDPDNFMVAVNNIKSELAKGIPVLTSIIAYEWERHLTGPLNTQYVIDPTQNYAIGRHEWLVVGYDDHLNGGSFIVENSWGAAWGDKGYGAFSYSMSPSIFEANAITGFNGLDISYTPEKIKVTELYAGIFGRAAEVSGLQYWAHQLEGSTSDQVAQNMYNVEASRILYPSTSSNEDIIKTFYLNVLGRQADSGGLDYWTSQLNSGISKGQVISTIINAVDSYAGTDFSALNSQHLFENKTAIGMHYAVTLAADDLTVASHAFDNVTSNPDTVEIVKIGLSQQLGWL